MKKISSGWTLLLAVLLCITLTLPAFASETDQEPLVITMLNVYFSNEPPAKDHQIYKMIEEQTGATFDITWVPAAGYAEKIVLMLASNEMPMVVNGKGETRKPIMIEAQRAGLFWELSDELLSEFPLSLNALNEDINANLRVDGKLYVLQQECPLGRENIIVRRDWLDALNLAEPNTLESLEACLYAFSENDPDGNGKDDTYGLYLTEDYVQNLAEWLCIAYGGANGWAISEDGEFIPAFNTSEYMQGLDTLRKWYADGVLNPDYVAMTATQDVHDAFMAQHSGIMLPLGLDDALKLTDLYNIAPDAVIDVIPYSYDVNGKPFVRATIGHNGGLLFTKSGIKDEDTLRRVLHVFDVINDVDGDIFQTMVWGIKDRHYTITEDGKILQTEEQKQLRNIEINNFIQLRSNFDYWAFTGDNAVVSDLQAAIWNGWQENAAYAVSNPTNSFISETYIELGVDLDTIWKDAVNKYIMGEIDVDGYNAEIERWYSEGGADVASEYAECYRIAQEA